MMEAIRKSLRDSALARWSALAIVAFTMLAGYYITDVMAPLKGLLEQQLTWNSAEYGLFTSAYGWFNVFLIMLILGGIVLDRMGVRFTGVGAASVMVLGAALKFWAVSTHSMDGVVWHILWFDIKAQVLLAALGFAIFGVGVEVAGITVSKIIVKWFKGKEMALAMGMQVSVARLGTALAIGVSAPIAIRMGHVSKPILLGLVLLCIGLITFILYTFMDKKLDASQLAADEANNTVPEEDKFKISDIGHIVSNRGWWYLAFLCVLFYSAVFPFLKFASDLMVQKFHVADSVAGTIPAMLPFGAILLTPLFGGVYDKIGKGANIMILGSVILIVVHALYSIPFFDSTILAVILILFLGVAFSLVPSAMWPSVPKIIPYKYLGTSFSMIFWVQNWGLMGVPALIGWVLQKYCITGYEIKGGVEVATYNYTLPMIIFTSFGVLALVFSLLLRAEDKKKGYGLQLPNIEKSK
ncbi:MAG: MFS transporter [Bacteroidetes bacterium]|nr:MAG: MFS transporter [Bacteroidota bacterium]RLE00498.1 MAG: MFS transporter [Bacteroidota bacterium]